MNQDGVWLSVLEYAHSKKSSISTVRRMIKAQAVKYREENGKYFIWTKTNNSQKQEDVELFELKRQNERLNIELRKLNEELVDLKMLLMAYENFDKDLLPPVPELNI